MSSVLSEGQVAKRERRVPLREELREIAARCAALPTIDHRSADEILGYDRQFSASFNRPTNSAAEVERASKRERNGGR